MDRHTKFLSKELREQVLEFDKVASSSAIDLLKSGQIVLGSHMSLKNGSLVIACNSTLIPRKGDHYLAFTLPKSSIDPRSWASESVSYRELVQKAISSSNAVSTWMTKGNNNDEIICGFTSVEHDFVESLDTGTIVLFGPKEPPIQYLINLQTHVDSGKQDEVLNLQTKSGGWDPVLVSNTNQRASFFINQLKIANNCVIQGPPGSGKTTLIGRIVSDLLSSQKSVLVTALTNNALMEVAKQKALRSYLNSGKIRKSNLTSDEKETLPEIETASDLIPSKGVAHLSTFYSASGLINEPNVQSYDYVIIDEASQAFLTTLSAFNSFGEKQLWVGDHMQMPPITLVNEDTLVDMAALSVKYGFQAVCESSVFPSFMLESTRRFGDRGADFTSIFYQGRLKSAFNRSEFLSEELPSIVNLEGGPILKEESLAIDDKAPKSGFNEVVHTINSLSKSLSDKDILVLAPFRKTVNSLKKHLLASNINVEVETVDRIQGKTVGACIYLIPNSSYFFSLSTERFNVATSRARLNTFIICDHGIYDQVPRKSLVGKYLAKLKLEYLEDGVIY
jgi:DNA replication ATP-dependent helicase Dna2